MYWQKPLIAAILAITLTACATAPEMIRTPIKGPSVAAAVDNPDRFNGERIRWGGTILNVENRQSETWVQIIAKRLQRNGRPITASESTGRFVAKMGGFLEPEIYKRAREITVVGTLTKSVTQNIGKFPYQFPVVQVDALHIWEEIPEYEPYYYHPYYWDPFYYPWWPHAPFYRYPYYRHRRY